MRRHVISQTGIKMNEYWLIFINKECELTLYLLRTLFKTVSCKPVITYMMCLSIRTVSNHSQNANEMKRFHCMVNKSCKIQRTGSRPKIEKLENEKISDDHRNKISTKWISSKEFRNFEISTAAVINIRETNSVSWKNVTTYVLMVVTLISRLIPIIVEFYWCQLH